MPGPRLIGTLTAIALLISTGATLAHEPGAPFGDWFMSLHQPDNPLASCCGIADQYYFREYHPSQRPGIAFEGIVEGKDGGSDFWLAVPNEKVDWDRVNPTGRGVVFVSMPEPWGEHGRIVYCMVPGTGA
jgi:hypothetical protein